MKPFFHLVITFTGECVIYFTELFLRSEDIKNRDVKYGMIISYLVPMADTASQLWHASFGESNIQLQTHPSCGAQGSLCLLMEVKLF